ncbi:MAG: hypothetical protein IJI14_00015 [Anaerolineaceae bacterium]|nr:hypothetical protein [Anaerolineaceae bacterium]
MRRRPRQAPLYLLTGLILGIALGLLFGYRIFPVQFFDITPVSLHPDFQKDYLSMVALAYHANNDIGRAYSRISEMMSPIDIDRLRTMSLNIDMNLDTKSDYELTRSFINDLQTYMSDTGRR